MPKISRFILLFLILEIVLVSTLLFLHYNKVDDYTTNRKLLAKKGFQGVITSYKKSSKYLYSSLIEDEEIFKILEKAQDQKTRDKAREELWNKLISSYNNLKKLGLKQLHFHLPNGDSFLRFHKPEKYGDNLFSVRESVRITNTEKIYSQGFEEGKIFNGYRFVFPIIYKERHLGSVETSVSMTQVIEELKEISNNQYSFIIKKEVVEKKLFKELIKDNYLESAISKDFYIEPSLKDSKIVKEINKHIKDEVTKNLQDSTSSIYSFNYESENYLTIFLPIENFKNEVVAYFIIYSQKGLINSFEKNLFFNILLATVSIFLVVTFMYKNALKHYKLKELNDHLESLVEEKVAHIAIQNDLLMKNSKMVAMGEMIGAISHQWKQPLNTLSLIIQDLEDASEYDELTKDYIKESVNNSMRQIEFMSRTITDFKDFLKPDKAQESFNVLETITSVTKILEKQLNSKGIELTVNCDKGFVITTYKGELEQIILNLINNAKDALVENNIPSPKIEILISKDEKLKTIQIKDNGGGVPEDIKDKIFDSHFTTKSDDKGTGIGLYISRMIARKSLGGDLTVENQDNGAIFTLTF